MAGRGAEQPAKAAGVDGDDAADNDVRVKVAIALLGDWAHLDVIAAACGLGADEAAARLARFERDGVIRGALPARFVDTAVGAEAIAAVTAPARALLHGRIADQLRERGAPDGEVCAHLLQAPGQRLQANVEALRRCATAQLREGRPDAAVACLERALREPPTEPELPGLLLALAGALLAEHRHADALHAATRARDCAATVSARADAEIAIFRARLGLGDVEHALADLTRRAEALRASDPGDALRLERELLRTGVSDARVLQAALDRHGKQSVDSSLPGADEYLAHAGQVLAMGGATSAGDAVAMVERFLTAHAGESLDTEDVVRAVWLLVRADEAGYARRAIDRARPWMATQPHQPALDAFEGVLTLRWGSILEAVAKLEGALALARRQRDLFATWIAAGFLGLALYEADRADRLERLLSEVDPDDHPESPFMAVLRVARARHLLDAGRPEEALADVMAVETRKVALGLTNPAGFHHVGPAVKALLALGEHAQATELAQLNLERAESWGAPITVALARAALAQCVAPRRGVPRLADALALLPASRQTLVRAQILLNLGHALGAAGRLRDSQTALREALDCAACVDAERIARDAHAALRALGARPRRRYVHGTGALTPAEQRVCALAASGMANREIAARLYLSVRTIENHLRHVYSKLDCDRGGLKARLAANQDAMRAGGPSE